MLCSLFPAPINKKTQTRIDIKDKEVGHLPYSFLAVTPLSRDFLVFSKTKDEVIKMARRKVRIIKDGKEHMKNAYIYDEPPKKTARKHLEENNYIPEGYDSYCDWDW